MNSKTKGGLGVCKTLEYLVKLGIPVFTEFLCDNSEIDIVVQHKRLLGVQVRTTQSHEDKAILSLRRVTPGTRNTPCVARGFSDIVDCFVLYVEDKDILIWIERKEIIGYKRSVCFRFREPKKVQGCGKIKYAYEYLTPYFME